MFSQGFKFVEGNSSNIAPFVSETASALPKKPLLNTKKFEYYASKRSLNIMRLKRSWNIMRLPCIKERGLYCLSCYIFDVRLSQSSFFLSLQFN